MTTRKELIIQKYTALETELKVYFNEELFPSLDSIDLADLVYYITITFLGVDTPIHYDSKIAELIKTNDIVIKQEDYKKISPLIMEFIMWLKTL